MKVVIIGMGASGLGVKILCEKYGYEYECIDADRSKGLPERSFIPNVDLYILSPGIPHTHPQISHAIAKNVPWIGESEFALRHARHQILGVTGTNGKTTFVSLLAHLIQGSVACGNIGYSLSQAVAECDEKTTLIAELSSYQLETMRTQALDGAVVLNIAPDHLDRYSSFEEYAAAKIRIKHLLKERAPLFVGVDVLERWKRELPSAKVVPPLERERAFLGKEMLAIAQTLSGLPDEIFFEKVEQFSIPPHRMEFVKKLDGISFYDDSKGTNVAAVMYALGRCDASIVLIAGGKGKGESFRPLRAFAKKIKTLIAIGETKEQIYKEISDVLPVEMALTLEEAVQKAYAAAERNEIVLLSPGCASFDMFANYKERGEMFKAAVESLSHSEEKEPEKRHAEAEQYLLF